MIIGCSITGAKNSAMMQFTPAEIAVIASALAQFVEAEESDMSGDRATDEEIKTARNLERRFRRGFIPMLYAGAEIVALYDAVNLYADVAEDIQDDDRAICDDMIETMRPAAIAAA